MSIDNSFLQNQGKVETFQPAEKLEGSKKQIWEKAKRILSSLGLDFSSHYGGEKGEEIVGRIDEIEQMTKGEDYDNVDDNLFIETEIDYQGRPAIFKMVGQAFNSNDYYKADIYLYYALTVASPLIAGWWKRKKSTPTGDAGGEIGRIKI